MMARACSGLARCFAVVVLAVPLALIDVVGTSAACGVERWPIKTGTDSDAHLIDLTRLVPTTVAELRSRPAPASLPDASRIAPTETTVYSVTATVTLYKRETDGDYHVIIADEQGSTMITEFGDPGCVGSGSPLLSGIQAARSQFDLRYTTTTSFRTINARATLTGVGFFDFIHGQTGVAPNGIELHPVLGINFLVPAAVGACDTPGSPTTTLYLPNITKTLGGPSGWYTPFIVQNIDSTSTTLEVSFYNFADGSLVACRKVTGLAPGTSFADVPNEDGDLPGNSQFAVVVRSFGAQVVSVVNEHQGSGSRAESGSYVGLSSGANKVYLPWVVNQGGGMYSTFIMQNLGTSQANVNISFIPYESAGSFTKTTPSATLSRSVAPGRSAFVDPRFESAVTPGDYAVVLTADQPIGVIENMHRDAASESRPWMFSYNGVGDPKATSYLPYVPRFVDGRTSIVLVQNAGTTSATPTVTFQSLASGVAPVTVTAPAAIGPGGAWFFSAGIGSPSTLSDGEWSAVVSGGEFAVLEVASGTTSAFGYTAAPTGTRAYLPNVTRTLGGTDGWTTPIVVQSAGASSATVRWYRFADGQLVQTQTLTGLSAGGSVRIDPRSVGGLVEATQYAVVVDSSGPLGALTTEYNFQGGDGAMVYEGFARTGGAPLPTPTPTPAPSANVVITNVFFDGVVPSVEADEYVEFRNQGAAAVSLTGWRIQSVRGAQSYSFPAGSSILTGQTCRLYTNETHPEWCGFNWSRTSAQWNNAGDRANLIDANGVVVSSFGWNGY